MTNTNELTAKLKAAAQDEIMCREACDTSDLWQDVASPENVLALTEALEAAEKRISELEKLAEAESVGADKMADSGVEWMKRCLAAEKRIAELEARTLTVKLPPEVQCSNVPFAADGANAMRKEVIKSLTEACDAAGIKLQIEGE